MKLDTAAKKTLADPKTRRAAVKYQLDLMGLNMSDLSREYGAERTCLYQVFSISYPKVERFVASKFGMTAREMFPERFNSDGSRKRKKSGPRPKKTTTKHTKNKRRRNVDGAPESGQRKAA